MREFQKIQIQWMSTPVQMDAGRGVEYFVLQHLEEHFTRLIIISAGRYSKDIVSLAQRIGVTVLSIVEDADSTAEIVQQSEEMIEISADNLPKEVFRLIC